MNRIYFFMAVFIASMIAATNLYWYNKGKSQARIEVRYETIERVVDTKQKQNAIRNNRPDDAGLYDSLRAGSF